MSEKKPKKKRVRGFAGVIAKNLEPINNKQKFKEDFKDTKLKILLNAKDARYAALIIIDQGTLKVEDVRNTPKENLKQEKLGWDGFLQMSTDLFFKMAMGELSKGKMIRKVLLRKIKVKNSKKVAVLDKLFSYLSE